MCLKAPQTQSGLERLLTAERGLLRGKRIALVANQTSVDRNLVHAAFHLEAGSDSQLVAVFGPEHGLWGTHQDMEPVAATALDPILRLPVHSLYGADEATLTPGRDAFEGIDVIVFDVQDVGARYYTFVYTLLHVMTAAAACGVPVIVCDRPNPLGGLLVEGPLLQPGYESFVGRWPLPIRHGLTVGELARLFNERIGASLHVVRMAEYGREMWFDDTGLPWVAPSPNMPTIATAWVYPGMCLLEGTNLSEGRGTTLPFELFGAPWLDARALVAALADLELRGVEFRSTLFRPMFHKYAGTVCAGAQVHVTDRAEFRPVLTGLAILTCVHALHPDAFRFRTEPYEYVSDRLAIDLLCGGPTFRHAILEGRDPREVMAATAAEVAGFEHERQRVRLYD